MKVQPTHDMGQDIAARGRIMGILPTQEAVDEFTDELERTGVTRANIQVFEGEEGIHLLDRIDWFFFADGESKAIADYIKELRHGRFVVSIRVADGETAQRVAALGAVHGGGEFTHFGQMLVTRFN